MQDESHFITIPSGKIKNPEKSFVKKIAETTPIIRWEENAQIKEKYPTVWRKKNFFQFLGSRSNSEKNYFQDHDLHKKNLTSTDIENM